MCASAAISAAPACSRVAENAVYFRIDLILSTLFLADIVVGNVTANIVPEEVPEDRDEGVVELSHGETVLTLQVVGLSLSPVEPLHGLVGVRPEPLAGVVLAVTLISEASQPELSELSHVSDGEKLSLQPVVESRTVQLCHPGLVEAAENRGVVPGDHLVLGQPEAVAAGPPIVLVPAVRTVEGVLGQD